MSSEDFRLDFREARDILARRVAEPAPETTEDLRVHLFKISDAVRLVENRDMVQALHVAPLLRYLLHRAGGR